VARLQKFGLWSNLGAWKGVIYIESEAAARLEPAAPLPLQIEYGFGADEHANILLLASLSLTRTFLRTAVQEGYTAYRRLAQPVPASSSSEWERNCYNVEFLRALLEFRYIPNAQKEGKVGEKPHILSYIARFEDGDLDT
jgi:hypothetical protein